jgi:uncharacterized metal-binding protein
VHDRVNAVAGVAIAVAVASSWGSAGTFGVAAWTSFGVGFLIGTLWLSPDLDVKGSNPKRRWGPLRILWMPYAYAFSHRGISHGYVIGPLTRVGYLFVLLLPLGMIDVVREGVTAAMNALPTEVWIAWLIGYYASCWLHLIVDRVPPKL